MAAPEVGLWTASIGYVCSGAVSGAVVEHSTYWPVVNTNRTLDGLPLWATADCRPDPAPPSGDITYPFDQVPNSGANIALYRVAAFTDRRLDGLPLMVAELDPCCDGGPSLGLPVITACCGTTVPATLSCAFTGVLSALGTVTFRYDAGSGRWESPTQTLSCWAYSLSFYLGCYTFPTTGATAFILIGVGFGGGSSNNYFASATLSITGSPPELVCSPFSLTFSSGLVSSTSTGCNGAFTAVFTG